MSTFLEFHTKQGDNSSSVQGVMTGKENEKSLGRRTAEKGHEKNRIKGDKRWQLTLHCHFFVDCR